MTDPAEIAVPSRRTVVELADWRRRVAELYAGVRACADPAEGHALWRAGRDALFRDHPQSPLPAADPLRDTGLPVAGYDPAWRFEAALEDAPPAAPLRLATGGDGTTTLVRVGRVRLPAPVDAPLDVWWLAQYGGGIFLPLRDGTSGASDAAGPASYGGGRYLLDTAKGADLGAAGLGAAGLGVAGLGAADPAAVVRGERAPLVLDLNFLYHPSCRYDPAWVCPLAPAGNWVTTPVPVGEHL